VATAVLRQDAVGTLEEDLNERAVGRRAPDVVHKIGEMDAFVGHRTRVRLSAGVSTLKRNLDSPILWMRQRAWTARDGRPGDIPGARFPSCAPSLLASRSATPRRALRARRLAHSGVGRRGSRRLSRGAEWSKDSGQGTSTKTPRRSRGAFVHLRAATTGAVSFPPPPVR